MKLHFTPLGFFLLFLLSFVTHRAQATHVRAGDLTAERLDEAALTYKFTATIYTDDAGVPPDELIEFDFGTGDSGEFPRVSFQSVGNGTTKNVYTAVYTFPGPGEYKVGVIIRNRNSNIVNIPNSVNVPFYIESTFLINPLLGLNSSPELFVPPIDFAARGRIFIHNPGAFDADGDSLAYRLVLCKKSQGQPVDGYRYPDNPAFGGLLEDQSGPAILTLDPITGDLVWNTPGQIGQYNVAFIVEEWRNGIRIGQVNRDMQIIVRDNPNNPPDVNFRDTCVVAGALLQDTVIATDVDRDFLELYYYGSLFDPPGIRVAPQQHATVEELGLQPPPGEERAVFRWQTVCEDVRRMPYTATFKAEDQPRFLPDKLVDLETWQIRVIGPKPDTLIAELLPGTPPAIQLSWFSYYCPNAQSMTVWRRIGSFPFQPDTCETGLPGYTGYSQIGETDIGTTEYLDDNNGLGLQRGRTYCYRIYAVFPEPGGGESYVSDEVCITIPTNAPYITNVSVEETSTDQGEIFVRWTRPVDVDSTEILPPYSYELFRAVGQAGTLEYAQVGGRFVENDTTFTDTDLNTEERSYNYRLHLYARGDELIDSSAVASSVRLEGTPEADALFLSWRYDVPWSNTVNSYPYHYIYRESLSTPGQFDLRDSVRVTTGTLSYTDRARDGEAPLEQKRDYCYYVLTQGSYERPDVLPEPLLNKSQRLCLRLLDEEPPCEPVNSVAIQPLDCEGINPADYCEQENFTNELRWESPTDPNCDPEILEYRVYFQPHIDSAFRQLTATQALSFRHTQTRTMAGCYFVTAVDLSGNESTASDTLCVENCPYYELPNVFTPNDDGDNDRFRPFDCPLFVEQVRFRVYNRWGRLIHESDDDIYLNWDGTDMEGNDLLPSVYYYEAEVTFNGYERQSTRTLKGWVQLLRDQRRRP